MILEFFMKHSHPKPEEIPAVSAFLLISAIKRIKGMESLYPQVYYNRMSMQHKAAWTRNIMYFYGGSFCFQWALPLREVP